MAVPPDPPSSKSSWHPSGWHCVQEQIAETVRRHAHRPALIQGGETWTFDDLSRRADAVACGLQSQGVGRGDFVGLCAERCPDTLAGLLGILRAGAAYVPLDPAFPADRLDFMVRDAGLRVVVARGALRTMAEAGGAVWFGLDGALADPPKEWKAVASGPEEPVYLIYTSGSTGKPKGVCIPQRAVVNFSRSMAEEPGITDRDTVLALTTFSFDMSKLEIFLPLMTGARMVIAGDAMRRDGRLLAAEIERAGVTILQATPGTLRMLRETGWEGSPRVKILTGAEPVPRALVNDLAGRCASLWNLYGPTETTVWSTLTRLHAGEGPVPIGRPIRGTRLLVVDDHLNPVPEGEVGELLIGGEGVALGYHRRPDLTVEKFLPDPDAPGRTVYRTGDLVRWRHGQLEFVARADQQVKIRGYRVELGEIEWAIEQAPGVKRAVVVAREEPSGAKRLVAFVVGPADFAAIRADLAGRLPDYMVPSTFISLEALPTNLNGKVDRLHLGRMPLPETRPPVVAAPATEWERTLHGIWSVALGRADFGCEDNFFDLGGDSLQLAVVQARLIQAAKREVPVTELFAHPTIRSLAGTFERGAADPGAAIRARAEKRRQALVARGGRA